VLEGQHLGLIKFVQREAWWPGQAEGARIHSGRHKNDLAHVPAAHGLT
jgi:hypothetical protein